MNKLVRYFFLLVLVSFVYLFSACQKKWKKPTNVSFNFRIDNDSKSELVKFTSAYIVLNEIYFSGIRSQGRKEVESEQEFSGNKRIDFSGNSIGSGIKFDIPQGTYSQIEIKLVTDPDSKGNSLQVNGTYPDSLNNTIPVQFAFPASDVIPMMSTNISGGNAIVLVEDHPATATITMNPVFWFASVSKSMMDKAKRESVCGVQTIIINNQENENIYSLIASRMKEGNQVVFN